MIDKLLDKHAKNFVSAERGDGELEGIHYHENGSVYVTDSHKLLAINNTRENNYKYTVHYKTGKAMNVDYPDVTRLLNNDYKDTVTLNMKNIKPYIPLFKVASDIDPVGDLLIGNGEITFQSQRTDESFKVQLGEIKNDYSMDKISLSVLYFYHMLQFFKDAKVDEITVSYKSHVYPVSFSSGDYEVLILPVRRY